MKRVVAFVGAMALAVYGAVTFWSRNKQRVNELDKPARKFTKLAKRSVKRFGSDAHDAVGDVKSSGVKTKKDLEHAADDAAKDAKHRLSQESS